ncbi:MAG: 4Fe-4S binding protein [Fimbriimonadaceae bacterium]|nr:4Fe-4S binding protein [Alphaproteobacteria bacterium]
MKPASCSQFTSGSAICSGAARSRAGQFSNRSVGRFTARIEGFFVRYQKHVAIVHGLMFLVFLALIVGPLFLGEPPENSSPLDHFTTFANFAMWGVWFPLVFLSVIFTGRSWCGLLCPMGAASEWANKHGLQRAIPRWIRWEGTPIVSFLIITILGQTVGVRDHPEAIAEVFGGTMLAAIAMGYVYGRNKRAWCRHACPIGLLLGVFSRLGAVQFVPKRKRPGGDAYSEKGLCPTMIDLKRKEESRHCIECFRCVKPEAKGGLFLRLRRPGEEVEEIRRHHPNPAEIWFLFLGTGVALGGFLWLTLPFFGRLRQIVGEWFISQGWTWIGYPGPSWLMVVQPARREVFVWLDFIMIVGFMLACMLALTALLTLTTSLSAWLSGRLGGDLDLRRRFLELGYQYAPVAMVSLIIGLGGELFEILTYAGLGKAEIGYAKGLLFLSGILWSIYLGYRILNVQGVAVKQRWLPLTPGIVGSLLVAAFWWPAIFAI